MDYTQKGEGVIRGSSVVEQRARNTLVGGSIPSPGTCPHCGQRMLTRLGVQLSPRQADLFDLIYRSSGGGGSPGWGGVGMEVLGWTWAGAEKSKLNQAYLIKATIYGINERLASTDYRIVGDGHRPVAYRLIQRRGQ